MAEKVVVTKSKLNALAAELRTLIGFTGNKTLDALTEEVAHYDPRPDTSDATATAAQILKPYTAYVNGGKVTGEIESRAAQTIAPSTKAQTIPAGVYLEGAQTIKAAPLQNKTVTPSKTQQSVKADAAYYGLDTVTVKAAPLQAKTVAPTTEAQTFAPDAGYIGFSEVTVQASSGVKKAGYLVPGSGTNALAIAGSGITNVMACNVVCTTGYADITESNVVYAGLLGGDENMSAITTRVMATTSLSRSNLFRCAATGDDEISCYVNNTNAKFSSAYQYLVEIFGT